jgi:hypothetical protein
MGTEPYAELIESCRLRGSDMDIAEFGRGCRRLANALRPDWDAGLDAHMDVLLKHRDRLAAALLAVPDQWGFRLERDLNGRSVASVTMPDQRGAQRLVDSDDEGAAILGALASTMGIDPQRI